MVSEVPSFVHEFQPPGTIHYGRGCVRDLDGFLAEHGLEAALVVTGENVGANKDVMGPLHDGLGDRLAGIFAETTSEKRIETAYDGFDRMETLDADVLVAVGAGSSLDIGRFIRLLSGKYRTLDEIRAEIDDAASVSVPSGQELVPLVNIPTTFAGADMSAAAAITYPTDAGDRIETIPIAHQLMPDGLFYDPDLFETTPTSVLTGSAINGFDKALETIYSTYANPITDGTAIKALQYFRESLPYLCERDDPEVMENTIVGTMLAQYGLSTPGAYKANVVHAFGHALRIEFGIQQGVAHAIMVPHVLKLLFDQVDGRRATLAEGLVQGDADDEAAAVVATVKEIRDGLGLASRLRDVDGPTRDGLHDAAVYAREDPFIGLGPEGFDPTVAEIEATLENAW